APVGSLQAHGFIGRLRNRSGIFALFENCHDEEFVFCTHGIPYASTLLSGRNRKRRSFEPWASVLRDAILPDYNGFMRYALLLAITLLAGVASAQTTKLR